jgi:hypothetical protein
MGLSYQAAQPSRYLNLLVLKQQSLLQNANRIPLPEDIFGSVQIVDGVIQPESYQRMPTHRIVSSLGLFQLSDHLHERLVHYLKTL